jgi:DNA repair exonuclease SbcCD ATPase subunit
MQVFQQTGVPKDMGISPRQQSQIDAMMQQLQAKYQAQYDRLNGLPAAERADRLAQLNREYSVAWLDGATRIFSGPQLTRYQQLQLQYGSFASLMDPVPQKALGLTDAQMNQLRQEVAWSTEQQAAIQKAAIADQARALQMFNDYNTAAQKRFDQLLNANQRQMWTQMIGSPFAFQPSFAPPTTGSGPTITGPGGKPIKM